MAEYLPTGMLSWLLREEQLADKVWLCCFKRPPGFEHVTPAQWLYVFDAPYSTGEPHTQIEFLCLPTPDPIVAECWAHEMRKKYSTPVAQVPAPV